jgi:hypothetical protein
MRLVTLLARSSRPRMMRAPESLAICGVCSRLLTGLTIDTPAWSRVVMARLCRTVFWV